jgi:2-polyprenyl-3-methyl-5-hydroxy-6-metoxy-1,4-benzoquinol methylase
MSVGRDRNAHQELEGEYRWESGGEQSHHKYLWNMVKAMLPKSEKLSVLDAGCGTGFIAAQIARLGHSVLGVDASREGVEIARHESPHLRFEVRSVYDDLADLAPPTGWDLIVSLEVIEHLFSPMRFLQNMHRHLRSDGTLILSAPYHGYVKNLAISIVNGWDLHHTVHWPCGHIKFFSHRTLNRVLADSGFESPFFRHSGRLPLLWKSMVCAAVKRDERPIKR